MLGYFKKNKAQCRTSARRAFLAGIAGATLALTAGLQSATARDTDEIGGKSADTPMHMVVSLDEQNISVYRGTELIKTAPISSGKRGHSTPTGVFSILEKRRRHFSNLYDDAPMPYMQRLTWSGIALHEGRLPGYPASHGCVRLPRDFAKELFGMTERGMHVVVTREKAVPETIRHSVLFQPAVPQTTVASLSAATLAADPALRGSIEAASLESDIPAAFVPNPYFDQPLRMIVTLNEPENETRTLQRLLNQLGYDAGPVDGVAGRKTRAAIALFQEGADLPKTGRVTDALTARLYAEAGYETPQNATLRVRRKFQDIYAAPVTLKNPDAPIGTQVFTAMGFEEGGSSVEWIAVPAEGTDRTAPLAVLDRLQMSDQVRDKLSGMLTPGTSLIVTDRGFKRNTGLGTDFVVITR